MSDVLGKAAAHARTGAEGHAAITVIGASGRFDRPVSALAAAIDRAHRTADLVLRTEQAVDSEARLNAFRNPGWSYFRAYADDGGDECTVEWDNDVLTLDGDPRAIPLTTRTWVRGAAYGGKEAAITHAAVVPLAHSAHPHRARVVAIAAHMPLDNTALRASIWHDCARGLVAIARDIRHADPAAKIVLYMDANRDYRNAVDRQLVDREITGPMHLTNGWSVGPLPATGTFHRELIDHVATDLAYAGPPTILPDPEDASDHNPQAVELYWSGVKM
jgi:hypothetical protein